MSFLSRLRTPIYQNTGSTARDHLASERTYLSWLRTGLGFIALGIAIERFSQLDIPQILATLNHQAPSQTSPLAQSSSQTGQQSSPTSERHKEHLLVGALLGTGAGSIVYGTTRYFTNLRLLERGQFKPAYFGVAGSSTLLAGLAGAVYVSAVREHRRRRNGD